MHIDGQAARGPQGVEVLTDQQIEAAARKLCELRGWNPDSEFTIKVYLPPNAAQVLNKVHKTCFQWEAMADEIRAADQVRDAIDSALMAELEAELEQVESGRFARMIEYFGQRDSQLNSIVPPPFCPPPGPCECGHSYYEHLRNRLNPDLHGCRFCDCTDYKGTTEPLSAPQGRG